MKAWLSQQPAWALAAAVVAAAVLVAAAVGVGSTGDVDAETECAQIRRDWAGYVGDADEASDLAREYERKGCVSLCGGLTEDTDTATTETWDC